MQRDLEIQCRGSGLPAELEEVVEDLARRTHEVWAAGRRAEGWSRGPERDDAKKEHPDLVPYETLTESEKEYDRSTVRALLSSLLELGFTVTRSKR